MRVNKNSKTSAAGKSAAPESKSSDAKAAAKGIHSTIMQIPAQIADRAARATGQAARSVQVDVKPGQTDLRARVPEGALPGAQKPEQNAGIDNGQVAGPNQEAKVIDPALREQLAGGGRISHELVLGEATGDGRHPDGGFSGGDIGIGNPYSGMDESAAGKLDAATRAFIDVAKANVNEAAAKGDEKGVNRWAGEVSKILGKGRGTENGKKIDANGNVAELTEAEAKQNAEAAEKAKAEEKAKTENQSGKPGKNAESKKARDKVIEEMNEESKPKDDAKKTTEDREPEYAAPDLHTGFIDQHQQIKFDAIRNSEINPGDQIQGTPNEFVGADSETYTANYGEDHREVTEDQIAAGAQRARDAADQDEVK